MAHFARVQDGIVHQVLVVANEAMTDDDGTEQEALGQELLTGLFGGEWVQCSYNGSMRGCYPGPGFLWDGVTFAAPDARGV